MNLYLVQHAEAEPEEEHPDRPLSDKGRNDIRRIASFLSGQKKLTLEKIFHSGKTRARQTAEVLAEFLLPAGGINETGDLKPMDDPGIWAARLKTINDDTMLVGHLPHMSKLASLLLCGDENRNVVAFQMGCVVSLIRDEANNYSIEWMLVPQMLR